MYCAKMEYQSITISSPSFYIPQKPIWEMGYKEVEKSGFWKVWAQNSHFLIFIAYAENMLTICYRMLIVYYKLITACLMCVAICNF